MNLCVEYDKITPNQIRLDYVVFQNLISISRLRTLEPSGLIMFNAGLRTDFLAVELLEVFLFSHGCQYFWHQEEFVAPRVLKDNKCQIFVMEAKTMKIRKKTQKCQLLTYVKVTLFGTNFDCPYL